MHLSLSYSSPLVFVPTNTVPLCFDFQNSRNEASSTMPRPDLPYFDPSTSHERASEVVRASEASRTVSRRATTSSQHRRQSMETTQTSDRNCVLPPISSLLHDLPEGQGGAAATTRPSPANPATPTSEASGELSMTKRARGGHQQQDHDLGRRWIDQTSYPQSHEASPTLPSSPQTLLSHHPSKQSYSTPLSTDNAQAVHFNSASGNPAASPGELVIMSAEDDEVRWEERGDVPSMPKRSRPNRALSLTSTTSTEGPYISSPRTLVQRDNWAVNYDRSSRVVEARRRAAENSRDMDVDEPESAVVMTPSTLSRAGSTGGVERSQRSQFSDLAPNSTPILSRTVRAEISQSNSRRSVDDSESSADSVMIKSYTLPITPSSLTPLSLPNRQDQGTPPPESPVENLAILKRRQNTIAARKSRERKSQYLNRLEDQVEQLTKERDSLKETVTRLEERVIIMGEMMYPDRENLRADLTRR